LADLLGSRDRWEEVVMQQSQEIAAYFDREYEKIVQTMYHRLVPSALPVRAANS
jgi:hypothetical protein